MKQSKKLLHFCIYLIFYTVLFTLTYFNVNKSKVLAAEKEEKWRVLFLSSYSKNFEIVPQQIEGVKEVLTEDIIVQNAKVPIYNQSIGGIGDGVLGGNMVSYVKSGSIAGEMVYKILNGTKVSELEVVMKSPMQFVFDYDIIKKYNIDVKLIPKDAILLNRELNFYEKNKEIILPMVWVFLALSFMLLFFVLDDIRRRRFSRVLKENHNHLMQAYEELAATEEELRVQYATIQEYADSIEQHANHDYLTKLPNRMNFAIRLDVELRKNNPCAIVLMDIDNFKRINDTLGHIYGDMLLKEIADRFITIRDDKLFVSRFGGDEFLLLIMENNLDAIQSYIWKIQELFSKPFLMNQRENYIQFSIGIARYPVNAHNSDDLIACADTAMYQAKSMGKNNYLFYENEMQEELFERSRIEDILRTAIHEDGFLLAYQPQVCVNTGEIAGFEALLRLKDYNIPPNQFIDVAEDTNLILEIGRIVTRKVIEQLVSWREQGLELKPVSINFSSIQIRDKAFIEFLDRMLKKNDILPSYIELEITESIFLENKDNVLEFLNKLRNIGITLSLDDFGSGYASVNYLTYVPIDKVKLDKSLADKFLKDDSKKTMESIILLAHSLNFNITAEGIEEFYQYTCLRELECDYIQGYLFSKPLIGDDVIDIYNLNLLEKVLHKVKENYN